MTALDSLRGPFVSLVGRLAISMRYPDEPAVGQLFCADHTHSQAIGGLIKYYCGAGRDIDGGVARDAAIGEGFERYGLRDLDPSRTVTASVTSLSAEGSRFVLPSALAPTRATDPVRRITSLDPPPGDGVEMRWYNTADLVTGEEVLVPAQYIVFVSRGCTEEGCTKCSGAPGEGYWCVAVSSGTAAGPSPAAACLSALLELIERDAFMLLWYHRLRFPFLRIDPHSRLGQRVSGMFDRQRIFVRFIDLTEIHGVPTVVAVARGRLRDRDVYAVGVSAALDCETAVWKAARELGGLYRLARFDVARGGAELAPEDVVLFEDHLRFYTNPNHQHELAFLLEDRATIPLPARRADGPRSPTRELRRLATRLRERDIHTYAADITPPDLPLDLYSYKVVSPELLPLENQHLNRYLNRERLLNEPTRRGWRADQPQLDQLNHAPHPFP